MTDVTVQLSEREIEALKARTGKRSATAALKDLGCPRECKALSCGTPKRS